MNSRGELIGRFYGRQRNPLMTYDIDTINSELVFSNTMDLIEVTLTYITTGVSRSTANVVTPYANDVISKYIVMMAAKAEKARLGEYQLAQQDYLNARRIFRARMNAMDYAEIIALIRNGINGALKN
jgi:hypothetical protein